MALIRRQTLFQLTNFQQSILLHASTQFAHQRDMFTDVPAQLSELGVLFDEFLHVGDGVDRGTGGCTRLVVQHVALDGRAEIAEVVVEVRGKEGVLVR